MSGCIDSFDLRPFCFSTLIIILFLLILLLSVNLKTTHLLDLKMLLTMDLDSVITSSFCCIQLTLVLGFCMETF